jgi:hypothetical protein
MIYSSTQIKSHDMFVRNNWDNVEPQGKEHMQQLGENHHFCPPSCGYDSPIYIGLEMVGDHGETPDGCVIIPPASGKVFGQDL